tara:strand:- start:1306 stop:3030 length:1725 start_codon:yes stop_codon:yes gene_type:complete
MLNIEKYYNDNCFKLPIEFLEKKKSISNELQQDLELIKNNDEKNDNPTSYDVVFQPKTNIGKECLSIWSKYYTTNKHFIKDSQKLYKNIGSLHQDKDLLENMMTIWGEFKTQNNFYEKFQYLDWTKFMFLNKSVLFLTIMSFYNLSSPILNLVAPVFILIVPFFILKVMKLPITWDTYYKILVENLKHHAIGKLLVSFNQVSLGQKVYIVFCLGLYFYNIYQNIILCYRFYKNTYLIVHNFEKTNEYLEYTIEKIKLTLYYTKSLKTYKKFNKQLTNYLTKLEKYRECIKNLPSNNGWQKFLQIGKLMKEFYLFYDSQEIENIMHWSFGFHGYIDTILGINTNISNNLIKPCKIKTKIKFDVQNIWHPCIKKPVKNNINLKKNIIITGPNAAGKTTLIKASIINLLLTQQIGYGFYDSCETGFFDYIHCYLNIPDTCSRDSLFQAEARRCKNILETVIENPNKKHFCIFDELYSGTNPYEAISSAYSYLKFIAKNKNVKFLLTTHYLKLCDLLKTNKKIDNKSMKTYIKNNISTYLYKLVNGKSELKGGVSVLKNLDYPDHILNETQDILKKLE